MRIYFILLSLLLSIQTPGQNLQTDAWKMKTDDGVRIYVKEFGEGDTVIVIHGGFGAEHSYMISAVEPFANKHRFVLYDQRGSLRSDCADSLITLDKHIEDLELLRQKLGLSKFTIVAHSMGGFVAMNYIQKYPGKVRKLIMICPAPAKGSFQALTSDIQETTLARWDRPDVTEELNKYGLKKELTKGVADQQSWLWNRITFAAINLHDVKKWRELGEGPLYYSNKAGIATVKSLTSDTWDFVDVLSKENIPVYVFEGDDNFVPYQYNEGWIKSVKTAHFFLLKNAGHNLWIDNYAEYRKIMLTIF